MKTYRASFAFLVSLWASSALAGPRLLTDDQLDRVTAGQVEDREIVSTQFNTGPIANQTVGTQQNIRNETTINRQPLPELRSAEGSGGAILGNESDATIRNTGLVRLSDTVQQNVRAMNLVNSADSSVANGVNVWRGQLAGQAAGGLVPFLFNDQTHADQINGISQDQSRFASVGSLTSSTVGTNIDKTTSRDTLKTLKDDVKMGAGTGGGSADGVHVTGDIDTKASAAWGLLSGEVKVNIRVDQNGAGCGGIITAECTAKRETSDADKSVFKDTSTISSAPTWQVTNGKAEFILGNDSRLDVQSDNTVHLTNSVQQNVRAMNVVNAASSVVGNGVNVAATNGLSTAAGSLFNLNQTNLIIQHR